MWFQRHILASHGQWPHFQAYRKGGMIPKSLENVPPRICRNYLPLPTKPSRSERMQSHQRALQAFLPLRAAGRTFPKVAAQIPTSSYCWGGNVHKSPKTQSLFFFFLYLEYQHVTLRTIQKLVNKHISHNLIRMWLWIVFRYFSTQVWSRIIQDPLASSRTTTPHR